MTRTTCPDCRLRFAAATAAVLPSCPFCDGPLALLTAEQSVGYQLADPIGSLAGASLARAASLPVPPTGGRRV